MITKKKLGKLITVLEFSLILAALVLFIAWFLIGIGAICYNRPLEDYFYGSCYATGLYFLIHNINKYFFTDEAK